MIEAGKGVDTRLMCLSTNGSASFVELSSNAFQLLVGERGGRWAGSVDHSNYHFNELGLLTRNSALDPYYLKT